jgi:acyl-homoserine-lactone acylase
MRSQTSTARRRTAFTLRVAAAVLLALVTGTSSSGVLPQGPGKGTEILWDRYGVPHTFAPDHASLFYAYGSAQMEADSELLLRLYAQARGRGGEFYGERYLAADRWVRTNGIPEMPGSGRPGRARSSAPSSSRSCAA